MQGVAGTQAQGVKLSAIILAGPTVLSAVRACPPHNGVRRRWWINVASAVSLTESSQKIWRSHHRHRPGRDLFSRGRGNSVISLCVLGSSLFPRPVELSLVDPHVVQDDRRPLRLASLIPQAFSTDHFGTRVSSTPAASNR